jgi:hypothetical protein
MRLTLADGKMLVSLQGVPGEATCTVQPAFMDCMNALLKDPVPSLDVCSDGTECNGEVRVAID